MSSVLPETFSNFNGFNSIKKNQGLEFCMWKPDNSSRNKDYEIFSCKILMVVLAILGSFLLFGYFQMSDLPLSSIVFLLFQNYCIIRYPMFTCKFNVTLYDNFY